MSGGRVKTSITFDKSDFLHRTTGTSGPLWLGPGAQYATDMLQAEMFARLSIVFMMGFVVVFDRMHWRHKYGWQAAHLMTQTELQRILQILAASEDERKPGA